MQRIAGHPTTGTCPAGGGHNYSGSGDYTLKSYAEVNATGCYASGVKDRSSLGIRLQDTVLNVGT